MIAYEWVVETIDEYEDIIETTGRDTFREALQDAAEILEQERGRVDIGLVRNESEDFEVYGIEDRQWAYLEDGRLPDRFDGGAKIPKKFFDEVQKEAGVKIINRQILRSLKNE